MPLLHPCKAGLPRRAVRVKELGNSVSLALIEIISVCSHYVNLYVNNLLHGPSMVPSMVLSSSSDSYLLAPL